MARFSSRPLVRLLVGALLALGAVAALPAACSDTSTSAKCTPGNGNFGARCCVASDCSAGTTCHAQQCTKACGDAGACDGLAPDGGDPGCTADGFCVTPAPPPVVDDGEHGW